MLYRSLVSNLQRPSVASDSLRLGGIKNPLLSFWTPSPSPSLRRANPETHENPETRYCCDDRLNLGWLARSAPPSGKGTAGDLRPVRPGGPGNWRTLKMWKFLQLCGEPVEKMRARRRRKVFQRIRDRLEGDGNYQSYVIPGGSQTRGAPAGDSVEVSLDKPNGKRLYGCVLVRASDKFCEAAQRAEQGQYQQVSAATYLGRPALLSKGASRTSIAPAGRISTSREGSGKRVAQEPHP